MHHLGNAALTARLEHYDVRHECYGATANGLSDTLR